MHTPTVAINLRRRRWHRGVALLVLLGFGVMLSGCTGLFFYPQRTLVRTPADLGLAYQDVHIQTSDGLTLHGWWLPAQARTPRAGGKKSAKGTILFLHGNAENISTHIFSVNWLPAQGYNVLLVDYRGYGSSQGAAQIDGIQQDIQHAIGYALSRADVDPRRFVVLGQSLGASLAIYAVAHSPYRAQIRALIAESGFADYRGIVREKLAQSWLTWPLQWPLSYLVTDRYSPVRAIPAISPIPVLLIHGDRDPIVPVGDVCQLYRAARAPKALWLVPGGGHIQAFRRAAFRQRLLRYLEAVLGPKSASGPASPALLNRVIKGGSAACPGL